jgi:hypothetical protein
MDDHSAEDAADVAMMNSNDLEKQREKAKKEILELTTKLRAFQQSNDVLEDFEGQAYEATKEGKGRRVPKIIIFSILMELGNGTRRRGKDLDLRGRNFQSSCGSRTRA